MNSKIKKIIYVILILLFVAGVLVYTGYYHSTACSFADDFSIWFWNNVAGWDNNPIKPIAEQAAKELKEEMAAGKVDPKVQAILDELKKMDKK